MRWPGPWAVALLGSALAGCQVDLERMLAQHKYEAYEASSAFEDGTVMRRPPAGTVARGAFRGPPEVTTGQRNGVDVALVPLEVDAAMLDRGQNRYQIFCTPCHGPLGDARTRVADQMRLRRPPSLHEPRLQRLPAGRVYRVVSHGYGLMPAYAASLGVPDRWAVVAYVQALQLSRQLLVSELTPDLRQDAEPWLR